MATVIYGSFGLLAATAGVAWAVFATCCVAGTDRGTASLAAAVSIVVAIGSLILARRFWRARIELNDGSLFVFNVESLLDPME